MKSPRRTSISFKMILTTTALVLVVVSILGAVNGYGTMRIYSEQAQTLSDALYQSIEKRGRVQTHDLVEASRTAILQNDFSTLQSFIPQIARDDGEVRYALVASPEGTVLAHTNPARNGQPLSDPFDSGLIAVNEPIARRVVREGADLYAFARPIMQDGHRVGAAVVTFNLNLLHEQIEKLLADQETARAASIARTTLVGLAALVLGTIFAVLQGLRISRPIKQLAARADQIAQGNLQARAEATSGDEIGTLGQSFNFMADRLSVLLQETAERASLEKELEVARAVQETLVPSSDLLERPSIKLAGYFLPTSHCGGDWWTVHDLADDKLLVVIGDVTGHGIPAAMITAAAKAACDTIRAITQGRMSVTYLLEGLNRAIFESAKRQFVMTCFASIIDMRTRMITFANAGHNFPYLFRPTKTGGANDFRVLVARGNRLGDMADSTYVAKSEQLQAGDTLIWYTDGIVECENPQGDEFGEKRFREAIRLAAKGEPAEVRRDIVARASQFFGSQPRKDDITFVVGKVYS